MVKWLYLIGGMVCLIIDCQPITIIGLLLILLFMIQLIEKSIMCCCSRTRSEEPVITITMEGENNGSSEC